MNETVTDNSLRMYVIVNRDVLPLVHCGVQASHAVHEYIWNHRDCPRTKQWCEIDKTLIFLSGNEENMNEMMIYCKKAGIPYSKFNEPDMNDKLTAVAFEPMKKFTGSLLFAKFNLLA